MVNSTRRRRAFPSLDLILGLLGAGLATAGVWNLAGWGAAALLLGVLVLAVATFVDFGGER